MPIISDGNAATRLRCSEGFIRNLLLSLVAKNVEKGSAFLVVSGKNIITTF